MRKPKIPNAPLRVRGGAWFYVSPTHVELYMPQGERGVRIPWGQLMRQAAKCGRWDAKQGLWFPSAGEKP